MSKKIAIIDYSLGNLFSVQQAFSQLGAETQITNSIEEIKSADGIVLPGVGAFGAAMDFLQVNKIDLAIKDTVQKGIPFFGICLGMQLLFEESEEFGSTKGLGMIKGKIKKFRSTDPSMKLHVPQVGWNTIQQPKNNNWQNSPLKELSNGSYMYFVHSYYAMPEHENDILCSTNYGGIEYCSAVQHNNIFATQFHPEKSGDKGLSIYKNWLTKI